MGPEASAPVYNTGGDPRDRGAASGTAKPLLRRAALPEFSSAPEEPSSPPDRVAADLGAVFLLTDRGVVHTRNEDAVAAAVVATPETRGRTTIVVVCDGVSSSPDPQLAAGIAARAGVDAGIAALRSDSHGACIALAGLQAAAAAVRDIAPLAGDAPSCTYVAAVVRDDGTGAVQVTVANVGDSRAYWLADPPPPDRCGSLRLTTDDSWAQALIDAGVKDEHSAMCDPRAHTLLRWLGGDRGVDTSSERDIVTHEFATSGMLLLCSDGLWNYLPRPEELLAVALGASPGQAAHALADHAVDCGGSDNITVALLPLNATSTT